MAATIKTQDGTGLMNGLDKTRYEFALQTLRVMSELRVGENDNPAEMAALLSAMAGAALVAIER